MNERPERLPARALIPNAITMLALSAGVSGIRFAIIGEFERAAGAIVVAAMLDGIDGRVARLLRGTSRFGAELDSLSDVTAFGIAPALVLYLWTLNDLGRWGWVLALLFAVCCALRLARYNSEIEYDDLPKKKLGFTTGAPAPAGAGMALAPLFYSLGTGNSLDVDPVLRGQIAAVAIVLSAFLMISSLPGWGWGSARIPRRLRIFLLVGVALAAAVIIQETWLTLFAIAVLYTVCFPFASLRYHRQRRAMEERGEDPAMLPEEDDPF